MIKVGLIGYGKWGKILKSKLDKFCDVKFVCRSEDNYFSEIINIFNKEDIDVVKAVKAATSSIKKIIK